MKFPNLVYKTPGKHQCHGGTFDYLQVTNEDELNKALSDGYYETIEKAFNKDSKVIDEQDDETAPPTREEMEEMAVKLNIGFNRKTTDETLLQRINTVMSKRDGVE